MSATEYDIHDELIQNECIRLHTHFKDRILQEKDFFELAQRVSCRKEEVGGQNEQIKSKPNVE